MSHFTVMVKLPKFKGTCRPSKKQAAVMSALTDALAPFNEQDGALGFHRFVAEPGYETLTSARVKHKATLKESVAFYTKHLREINAKIKAKAPKDRDWDKPWAEQALESKKAIEDRQRELLALPEASDTTLKKLVRDYYGYKFDAKSGAFGYTRNPDAKWDWWSLGGRWGGMLVLRHPGLGYQGDAGAFGPNPKSLEADRTDAALMKDIDWETIQKRGLEEGQKIWDESASMPEAERSAERYGHLRRNDDTRDKTDTRETYAKRHALGAISTRAVLDEQGKWHEPGSMGWWGMSSETTEEAAKHAETFFSRFIEPTAPDTLIAIVDCHI